MLVEIERGDEEDVGGEREEMKKMFRVERGRRMRERMGYWLAN